MCSGGLESREKARGGGWMGGGVVSYSLWLSQGRVSWLNQMAALPSI